MAYNARPNEKRERIHAVLRQHRVATFNELCRHAGYGGGVVAHHVRILKRLGLVQDRTIGGRRYIMPADAHLENPELEHAIQSDDATRAILDIVRTQTWPSQTQVMHAAGLQRTAAQTRLRKLERLGAIQVRHAYRSIRYGVTA